MLATTTDRLRRLDALFAEKVLGAVATRVITDAHAYVAWKQPNDEDDLPRYTRSLDAAWKGVPSRFAVSRISLDVQYGATAVVEVHAGPDVKAAASHPAEALVLAALRAVGCSEEELE